MPRTIVQHETWCHQHDDEFDGGLCASRFYEFGPPDESATAEPDERVGYMYLARVGAENADVNIFFPTSARGSDAIFGVGVLRQLVAALDADPTGTHAALRDILAIHDQEAS